SDASPRAMQRFIYAYGTYLQAAHYMIGARSLGVEADYFVLIAVEKEPPYGIGIYNIRGDALMAGEEELAKLLRTWSECETAGQWPGYSELALDITLPGWAFGQIENGLEADMAGPRSATALSPSSRTATTSRTGTRRLRRWCRRRRP